VLGAAADSVARLPPVPKRHVRAVLDELVHESLEGEPLRGELDGLSRVRVGRLRVVYRVHENVIEIVAIGPRASIYVDLLRERRRSR